MKHISLVVVDSDGEESRFMVRRDRPLSSVAKAYQEQTLGSTGPVRLRYEGQDLMLEKTIEELGLEDQALILAISQNLERRRPTSSSRPAVRVRDSCDLDAEAKDACVAACCDADEAWEAASASSLGSDAELDSASDAGDAADTDGAASASARRKDGKPSQPGAAVGGLAALAAQLQRDNARLRAALVQARSQAEELARPGGSAHEADLQHLLSLVRGFGQEWLSPDNAGVSSETSTRCSSIAGDSDCTATLRRRGQPQVFQLDGAKGAMVNDAESFAREAEAEMLHEQLQAVRWVVDASKAEAKQLRSQLACRA